MNKIFGAISILISLALYGFTIWLTWYRWKNDQDVLVPIILYLCLRNWMRSFDLDSKLNELVSRQPQLIGAYKRKPRV